MTAERYYVRRPTGKVFGPFDKNAVQLMLKSNKLDSNAEVSRDKIAWRALADVPDFAQFVRPAGRPGGTVMGMAAVSADGMHPGPPSGADLPRPVGFSDLPRPASGPGLPQSAGLPRPVGNADLPRPINADLPRPAAGPGLPAPVSSLPRPVHTGAPSLQAEEADLFGAPMSIAQEDDLFGAPASMASEDDLFGAPQTQADEDDLFVQQNSHQEDDLFGAPVHQEDNLFGAPQAQAPEDDLFGNSNDADLFSGNAQELQADDLFGGDSGQISEGSEALYGEDDDFLGGSQGFSFLDDGGSNTQHDQEPVDEWDQDLLGGGSAGSQDASWDDNLLTGNAPPATQSSFSNTPAAAPMSPSPAPSIQPASTGVPSQGIASTGAPAKSAANDKGNVADSDKKRNKMVMIGLPILAILIIAVAALAAQRFMSDDTIEDGPVVVKAKPFTYTYEELQAPNYAVVQQKVAKSKKGSPSEASQSRLLLAHALMYDLHKDDASLQAGQALATKLTASKSEDATLARGALLVAEGKMQEGRSLLATVKDSEGAVGAFAHLFLGIEAGRRLDAMRSTAPAAALPSPDDIKKEDKPKEEPKDAKKEKKDGVEGEPAEEAPVEVPKTDPIKELEQEVAAHFKAAEAWHPTLPMHQLGVLREKQGNLKESAGYFRDALESDKDFVSSNVALGRVLYRQGELNESIKFLNRMNNDLVQYAYPKEKSEALHYAGMVYAARSQHKESIKYFTKALASDATRSDTLRALAESYEKAQEYKEALTFFRTNKTLGQSDPDVMLGIVRAHIGLKEWAQAIAQLEIGEKKFPTDARFPYYLGDLNRRRGAFFEAQKSLASAVEIDPTLLMAHAMLAQLAWRTDQDVKRGDGHIQEIVSRPDQIDARVATEVAQFYKLTGNFELAKQWYNAAIKRDPNYWAARLPLARLLLEKGETKNALALLERSRAEGVTDIKLSAYLADAYRQSKLFDKAIDEINEVIEQVPSKDTVQRAEYIFIRGRIYYDRGNYDTALEDFNQAYTLNTNLYDANFYVGRTKLAQGDTATAIKIFRSVLDYLPNSGEYRFAMGEALQKEERLTQALAEYRKVTEVDPGYASRTPNVYITRGRLLSQLGYSRDGRKDIKQALKLAPEMAEALIAMGEVDYRDQRYKEAIANLSKALNKEPKHPHAQHKLGMSHIYLENLREGIRHLELALRYDFPDPDAYRTLGYVYKQLGETAQAKQAFKAFLQKALTTEQPLGTTKEVRRQLKELGG